MEKQAAAEFLGVSVRTLERFAAAGKVKTGRARRKTRPVVTYDEFDLERLRVELAGRSTGEVFGRPNTSQTKGAIGFRLTTHYIQRLEEEGEKRNMSSSEFARMLVIRGLEEHPSERFINEVRAVREHLGEMFYLVLVSKLGATEQEAADIIKLITKGAG
ncbi:MAG: hypothetical protein WCK51_15855 [Armatimonadota bacterium]